MIETLTFLANVVRKMGKARGCLPYGRRALEIAKKKLRPGHPLLASTQQVLGQCLLHLKRPDQAVVQFEAALRYQEKLTADPPKTGTIRFQLARALWKAGHNRRRAVFLAQRAGKSALHPDARSGDRVSHHRCAGDLPAAARNTKSVHPATGGHTLG